MKFTLLLSVCIVLVLLCSTTLGTRTKSKLKRKLFSEMKGEIENLVEKPRGESEIENLREKTLSNNLNPDYEDSDEMDSQAELGTDSESSSLSEALKKDAKKGTDKKHKKIRMRYLTYGQEVQRTDLDLQDWLTVTSSDYARMKKYPSAQDTFINLNGNYTRINEKYINNVTTNGIPGPDYFWFRQNLKYIYYFETKKSTNALGTIFLDNIHNVRDILKEKNCFTIFMKEDTTYKLCAKTFAIKKKWLCKLQTIIGVTHSAVCTGKHGADGDSSGKFRIKKVVQPMILIPMPSKHCNENWNYARDGADWNCKCSQFDGGVLQSPINLPPVKKAINTIISPVFQYEIVKTIAEANSANGMIKEGDNQKIFFKDGALRIYSESFGKIVTLDGTGYYAEEINFHTPSEHTINGRRFDMEMKVIHRARTVGDFGKTLTLSFMFKSKPGAYNKFLDKLDFFNLPNPFEKYQELKEDIFIPNVFLDEDIEGSGEMTPFSFYSYEGSITEPPCTEKTIVIVASDPIPVSTATMQLFREALSQPDQIDWSGRIINSPKDLTNYRRIQPQKGRAIFHYDKKNECNSFLKHIKDKNRGKGHYERVKRVGATYYFVPGEKPSGLPGAYVVTDEEAKAHLDPEMM